MNIASDSIFAKDQSITRLQQNVKQFENKIREMEFSAQESSMKLNGRHAKKAMDEEKMGYLQTIEDLKFILLYGDSQKDKEMELLAKSCDEKVTQKEEELAKKLEEVNSLKFQLKQIQERRIEEWMFDGRNEFK